jgi:hypothetical protein
MWANDKKYKPFQYPGRRRLHIPRGELFRRPATRCFRLKQYQDNFNIARGLSFTDRLWECDGDLAPGVGVTAALAGAGIYVPGAYAA